MTQKEIDTLAAELWEIRLALSFGTTDVQAAIKIRDALQRLDIVRARLVLTPMGLKP